LTNPRTFLNNSAEYLAAQRQSFLVGYPPYDFSGGAGEGAFADRASVEDLYPNAVSRRAAGFEAFSVVRDTDAGTGAVTSSSSSPEGGLRLAGKRELMRRANEWLFGMEA